HPGCEAARNQPPDAALPDGEAPHRDPSAAQCVGGISMTWTPVQGRRAVVVAGSLLVIALLHVFSNAMEHELHNFYFKATYVPLVLAGWWFHLRGGLVASGVMSAFSLVHYFTQLAEHAEHGGHPPWSVVADICLYNIVAFTTGLLSQRRD